MRPQIAMSMNLAPLKRLQKASPVIFSKAMEKGAIQFLRWANDGSEREPRRPPIKWGVLRGSGSAFVGGKLVALTPGEGTPLSSYSESPTTITWVWNTPYAAAMHEHQGNWGPATENDPNAGNKWLEKHLIKDKEALMDMIENEYWRLAEGLD